MNVDVKWKFKKLGLVCKTGAGGTPLKSKKEYYANANIPWLLSGEVNNRNITESKNFISKLGLENSSARIFPKNSVLIAMYGATAGQVGILRFEAASNQAVCAIYPNDTFISEFLYYFFLNEKERLIAKAVGNAQPNISQVKIKDTEVPIIPLKEQQTIVAKLDQAFAAIDQAKANIETNISNAKELFQSKLNQIFSQNVDGWVEKRIKEIGKVQTGTTPPTKDKDNYGEFIPFIKPAHFNSDGSLTPLDSYLSEKGIKKSRLIEANSVLMVCIGATIGKTGFTEIDVTCNQQINTVTPSKNYNYKFIYFGMISRIFQDEVLENGKGAQATLPIINKSKWENLFLNINPNKDVQQQIVTQLDQLQEQTNQLVTKYQQKLANLEELKKSILEKAFKGELT